ncbi:Holliday junction branch migration protein RuvA [Agaribacter flavus]|uniref:Holliday junction branch migration complex subunit RuvA n=1 Tax=Agaribacter flavus TaxID=1902781 RepID=A0ABV7FNG8_9ALTE
MIGRLHGKLLEKQPPEILLDINGVAYEVQLPMTSFYHLPEVGESATIYTHFVVREDAQLLFGFIDKYERGLFRVLIKANGVGPKLACTILSGMSASQFIQAVLEEDITALVKMPGVGKKTAERLVVELKDKVANIDEVSSAVDVLNPSINKAELLIPVNLAKEEATSALLALGYKKAQAEKAINAIYDEHASSETLIREALKSMV